MQNDDIHALFGLVTAQQLILSSLVDLLHSSQAVNRQAVIDRLRVLIHKQTQSAAPESKHVLPALQAFLQVTEGQAATERGER